MTAQAIEAGTSETAADYIAQLEGALRAAAGNLQTVGDDYPGSSCQDWCRRQAEIALSALRNKEAPRGQAD